MSIIDDLRLPGKPPVAATDLPAVYLIVNAGGMAYGQGCDEQFLPLSKLGDSHIRELDRLFVNWMFGPSDRKWDCETVWGQKLFCLDSEDWRVRMMPKTKQMWVVGPANAPRREWRDPDPKDYPQLGRRAIKWCLDGITQRHFALGPMTIEEAERLHRDKGPAGIQITTRAELEATFSHPNNWGGVHTDG